ncbi:hypothetical protein [Candidatus Finniella inopinata]|uniref:Uncharacterized protein n=1 Tax=Candidatus Finniella inopinata TaxID=1696036 RepID=A0A4Q7DI41_9PROT|nr:hypothetical protein [Candidatus Finniella inopinata]RZI46443.1 hypothetical protein EQU50_02300 [Candidatus Finniella inopinata]
MFSLSQKHSFLAIALLATSLTPCFSSAVDDVNGSSGVSSCSSRPLTQIEVRIRAMHPKLFTGENNPSIPGAAQKSLCAFLEDERKKPSTISQPDFLESNPYGFLIAYAQAFQTYVGSLKFDGKDIILKDLERYIAKNAVSANELLMLALRIQGAQSTPSDDEKDLYKHLYKPAEELIEGVMLGQAWKSDMQTVKQIEKYKNQIQYKKAYDDDYYQPNLASEVYKTLHTQLEQILPIQHYIPLPGENYLGIHYLLDCQFDDHFPIALPKPDQSTSAHGVKMAPITFTVHDYLHFLIDGRRRALRQYARTLLDEAVSKGADYEEAMPIVVQQVAGHYKLVTNSFRSLLRALDRRAISETAPMAQNDYYRNLSALFWMVRETPTAWTGCFEKKILPDLLAQMAKNAKDSLSDIESWENEFDPFCTSPIDGKPFRTNDEIITEIVDKPENAKPFLNHYMSGTFTKEDVKRAIVKPTPRFTDVIVTSKRGESWHYSFPTLHHKYKNACDNLKLLRWAGSNLSFEALTLDPTEGRATAIKSLQLVRSSLTNNIDFFLATSRELYKDTSVSSESLEQEFAKSMTSLIQAPTEAVQQLSVEKEGKAEKK